MIDPDQPERQRLGIREPRVRGPDLAIDATPLSHSLPFIEFQLHLTSHCSSHFPTLSRSAPPYCGAI